MASLKNVLTRVNTARTALERAVSLLDVLEPTPSRTNIFSQTELIKIIGRLESIASILRNELGKGEKDDEAT